MANITQNAQENAPRPDYDAMVVWKYQRELVCTMRWERRHQVVVYVHDGGRLQVARRFRDEVQAGQFCESLQLKLSGSRWSPAFTPRHEWKKPR